LRRPSAVDRVQKIGDYYGLKPYKKERRKEIAGQKREPAATKKKWPPIIRD